MARYGEFFTHQSRNYYSVHHQPRILKPKDKQFVYMYNVADCLPLDILTKDTLLNGTNRDILVLSYMSPCQRKDPAHIEYMFTGNKTTWGEGRNMLYW